MCHRVADRQLIAGCAIPEGTAPNLILPLHVGDKMGEIVEGEVWEGRRSDGIPTIERPEPTQENGTL